MNFYPVEKEDEEKEEVDMLNSLGIDVIILDHHEAGPLGRPDAAAVVNAKIEKIACVGT